MNKKLIALTFVLTLVAGLVLSFNPAGANPLKEKTITTMKWDKALDPTETVLAEKESNTAKPTDLELEKVWKQYQEVAP
jgi:hypothetical protein